ncbi:class I SAM-dependent DNA methyltransferase [Elongatibacter sediminis]|uniref:Class I SAM-dependent methyltransferase n=1 Tax=Elongatibacter sediminis TaxID=3119006 RepID=A0AAW9RKF2_9GAMM
MNPGQTRAERFWNQRIGNDPDESSIGCAGFGRNYNRWLYRVRARRFRAVVRELAVDIRQCTILDAGSGTGFYLDQWQQLGARRIHGLDFSEAALDYLQPRFPTITLHHQDLSGVTNLPQAGFDLVSAFDVLFHIVDDPCYDRAIANIAQALKPGGYLLLSENFTHHVRARGGTYHYSRTLTDIHERLARQGLELLFRRPMFVLMNAPDDSTSALLRAWWRLVGRVARHSEITGWLTGALLYPYERVLTRLLRESPSTEIAVCRRMAAEVTAP